MKLKDMTMTKSEVEGAEPTAIASDQPSYYYGLTLRLEEDVIGKLGFDKLPSPGEYVSGAFKAMVESASVSKDKDKTRRSLVLQITKLGVGDIEIEEESESVGDQTQKEKPSADKVLYGD